MSAPQWTNTVGMALLDRASTLLDDFQAGCSAQQEITVHLLKDACDLIDAIEAFRRGIKYDWPKKDLSMLTQNAALRESYQAALIRLGQRWAAKQTEVDLSQREISVEAQTALAKTSATCVEAMLQALLPGDDDKLRNFAAKLLTVQLIRQVAEEQLSALRLEMADVFLAEIRGEYITDKQIANVSNTWLDFAEELITAVGATPAQQSEVRSILQAYL